jgi:hypothetical protein
MSSPTQRSLKFLREQGYHAAIVEKFNQFARIRQDVFKFGDLLAMHPEHGIVLVQTTSGSNMAARRTKIAENPLAPAWKAAGGKILLHGWSKQGARGKRKTWQVREESL